VSGSAALRRASSRRRDCGQCGGRDRDHEVERAEGVPGVGNGASGGRAGVACCDEDDGERGRCDIAPAGAGGEHGRELATGGEHQERDADEAECIDPDQRAERERVDPSAQRRHRGARHDRADNQGEDDELRPRSSGRLEGPGPDGSPMPPRPYMLNELTWKTVRDARYEVAVLPWGATEAHNLHLPYTTDNIETERIAALAAGHAWERGARVVVLPLVPFGVNTGQLDIPLCLNLNPSTQALVLRDLATALAGQGVPKLVILNGHGGNDFRQMIRELQSAVSLFLCTVNWYQVVDPKLFFSDLGDHAGELETSVMLHVAPELVRPLSDAGPGRARRFTIAALREGVGAAAVAPGDGRHRRREPRGGDRGEGAEVRGGGEREDRGIPGGAGAGR